MASGSDRIPRNPDQAAGQAYDVVIIGGGIYGAFALLEAARSGLRAILMEKGDFGGAASHASLRIVHGGLRYLQSLDFKRHRESVSERRWFLRHLPELVTPLRCLMPLYNEGLRRPGAFRAALLMNGLLARQRNAGVREDRRLENGAVLGPEGVAQEFPGVRRDRLSGGALWCDAVMLSSERVQMELLRWACAYGATALNYVKATGAVVEGGRVAAVEARDEVSGAAVRFAVKAEGAVVNCAGSWCREVAAALDRDHAELFTKSLAFNLLLEVGPPSECAVAVTPPKNAGQTEKPRTYFVVPWKRGLTLAGTYHMTYAGGLDGATPPEEVVQRMLAELGQAIPGWQVQRSDVLRVYAGVLPAKGAGEADMAHHPVFVKHGERGGPANLVSVSGVKYTTARMVARQTLRLALGPRFAAGLWEDAALTDIDRAQALAMRRRAALADVGGAALDDPMIGQLIQEVRRDEAVVHDDDLVLRRVDGAYRDEERQRVCAAMKSSGAEAHGLDNRGGSPGLE